jgi:hypothetical protein
MVFIVKNVSIYPSLTVDPKRIWKNGWISGYNNVHPSLISENDAKQYKT